MIRRLPRVIYTSLPEGQDWTIRTIDGRSTILIHEGLGDDDRRAARKAAYATVRGGIPRWIPLPAAVIFAWLAHQARTPLGAAGLATAATAVTVYAVTTLDGHPEPLKLAEPPPAVVTLQPSITPTITLIRTATPTRTTVRPTTASPGTSPPTFTTRPPERTRPPSTPPQRTAAASTAPPPTAASRSAPPGGDTSGEPSTTPTRTGPPTTQPSITVTTEPTITASPPTETPPPQTSGPPTARAACEGLGLRVDLQPIVNVDACLL